MIYGNFIFATFLMALPIAFAQSPSPTSTLCATAVTYLQLETLPPNPAEFEASMESKYITYEVTAPITTAGDRVRVGFVENEGLYAVLESYIRSENLPIVTLTSTQSVRCPTALPPSPTGLGKCTVRVDQWRCEGPAVTDLGSSTTESSSETPTPTPTESANDDDDSCEADDDTTDPSSNAASASSGSASSSPTAAPENSGATSVTVISGALLSCILLAVATL